MGKAWWDTPAIPALGSRNKSIIANSRPFLVCMVSARTFRSHWYIAIERNISKTLVCGLYEHQQPLCPKCADSATPTKYKHRLFPEAQKRPLRLAWR